MIPRFAPTYSYRDLLDAALRTVYDHRGRDLCRSLAALYGLKYVFLFSKARVALYALLKAYNRPGGVLIPAYNCIVVPEAIHFAGYRPVFVDIDRSTLNMTVDGIRESLTDEISVVMATHLFGIPCDVERIRQAVRGHDLLLVEDAAPALGAELHGRLAGTFGHATVISFHSTKVLSAETGGALLTDDEELAHRVRLVMKAFRARTRAWWTFATGLARKTSMDPRLYSIVHRGYRALGKERMYEVVPAQRDTPRGFLQPCPDLSTHLVLRQLDRLQEILMRRRRNASIYFSELSGLHWLTLPVIPKGSHPAWIQFPVQVEDKEAFYRHMQCHNVDLTWTYRYSCAESYGLDRFPNAHQAAETVLGLPTYPSLSEKQVQHICRVAKMYQTPKPTISR